MKKKSAIAAIILIAVVIYPTWKIQSAKSHIHRFSSQISVGMPIERAERLAIEMNLKHYKTDRGDKGQAKLIVIEGWAFARWVCDVSYENGKITKVQMLNMD